MNNLRITPIGTCRIHTPLKRAAARYPIDLDIRRNYGFVHSSGEALQLVQFLQGDKEFAPEAAPLIFRESDLAGYAAQSWERADLHIVEISSSKIVKSGADAVQQNYVAHHFADFFANTKRSLTFWTLVRKAHRGDLLDFLREEPTFQRLSPPDRKLLLNLSMEQQSYRGLLADMTEIVERLGKDRVVFVTHVNAVTPDDCVIPARDRLIRLVKTAAEQLGAPVFDPTAAMRKFGQDRSMENGGLDLTHFTPAFCDVVYDELHLSHIAPALSAQPDLAHAMAAPDPGAAAAARLTAALELEDFEAAARKVHLAVKETPDSLPLIELRGLVRFRIGDFENAAADLGKRGEDADLPHEMRLALLESLCEIGDMAAALRVAENLIADEFESAPIYGLAAQAAQQLGRMDEAVSYAKQAFRRDHEDLGAALRALTITTEHSDPAEAAEWRAEILENMSGISNDAFEACLWAVEHRDDAMFTAALGSVRARDKAGVIGLLENAAEAGMFRAIADSIGLALDLGRLDPGLTQRRVDIFQWALDEATRLLDARRPADAHYLAGSLAALAGESAAGLRLDKFALLASRLTRLVQRDVLKTIRAAYAQGDQETVARLGEDSADILQSDPDAAVIVARSLQSQGRTEDAIEFLTAAQAANPDHFGARRWLARYAAFARNYALAIDMYGELDRSNPAFPSIAPEVERFFESVEPRAIKQLRELLVADREEEAFTLVGALRAHTAAQEGCQRELARKHGNLRRRLMEVERGERDIDEREPILRMMLRIDPDDGSALRRLALECMRQFRFAEAAEYWERLRSLSPDNESVERNRERCQILAQRRVNSLVKQAAA